MTKTVKPDLVSSRHLSMLIDGRNDVEFEFACRPGRTAAAMLVSMAIQVGTLILLLFAGRWGLEKVDVLPQRPRIVFVADQSGTDGGGGGGGGNQMTEPPQKAAIPKPKPLEVARLEETRADPTPTLNVDIPITTLAQIALPGAMQAPEGLSTLSQGAGVGGGGDLGRGTGIGGGDGPGLGPGWGGNMNGGPRRPGNGVTNPVPTFEALPVYTGEAMRARIEGEVWVECTVTRFGTCIDGHVVRSLDSRYGLDREAVAAARKWRFKPGLFQGKPVDVIVLIGIEFRLR
jgi:protein TonB